MKNEKIEKTFFVEATELAKINGNEFIPTAICYSKKGPLYGHEAIDSQLDLKIVNTNFKVALGEYSIKGIKKNNQLFETEDGREKSAFEITKDFFTMVLENVERQLNISEYEKKGLKVLVAEPLSFHIENESDSWIKNYRDNIERILHQYEEVEFLPEPFAVYQFYRYGLKIPQLKDDTKHIVFIIDFGGGTFDVSIIESTNKGDISLTGKHSKPFAASSEPVGGFFVNELIAEYLISRDINDNGKRKASQYIKTYQRVLKGEIEFLNLNSGKQSFIKNIGQLKQTVENIKIRLCNKIQNWELNSDCYEKVFVDVPIDPFSYETKWQKVSFHGHELRKIFRHQVWEMKIKKIIKTALNRAEKDLKGKYITVTLISGGSSNIRWLENLLASDFSDELAHAKPVPLSGSFQEVVAKGLSIECARRYYEPNSEFVSVTYNPVRLLLNPDNKGVEEAKFKSIENKIDMDGTLAGDILPSAQALKNFINEPLQWKAKLSSPPRKTLRYHFTRPSGLDLSEQPDDVYNLYNIQNTVNTSPKTIFDSKIRVELVVKKDGTAYPKFIYKVGNPELKIKEFAENGEPFVLDMTKDTEILLDSNRYIGFDFGTSNSSISYLTNDHIHTFNVRSSEDSWQELKELIHKLPYPISLPIRKYLGSTNGDKMTKDARDAFEAILSFCAYLAISELIAHGKYNKKLINSFPHRSMGPLKDLLQKCLKKLKKDSQFVGPLNKIFDTKLCDIDIAIKEFNEHKHNIRSSEKVSCHEHLKFLANVANETLKNKIFGYFENVTPIKFKKGLYNGIFKVASDNQPFFDSFKYEGKYPFDISQPILIDINSGKGISLFPFYFWDEDSKYARSIKCYVFDKKDGKTCCFKTVEEDDSIGLINEYEELNDSINSIFEGDIQSTELYEIELHNIE